MNPPFELSRFIDAQAHSYTQAVAELRAGRKRSHWSWYVLPQLQGLGQSEMSQRYAISGLDEARAFLEHPVLGARLRECVNLINSHRGLDAEAILGEVDAMKLHSCLTLFAQVAEPGSVFHQGLQRHFEGFPDHQTLRLLRNGD